MLEALAKTNFNTDFKSSFEYIIQNKITKQQLMETICEIKALKNNSLIINSSVLGISTVTQSPCSTKT